MHSLRQIDLEATWQVTANFRLSAWQWNSQITQQDTFLIYNESSTESTEK